jgi:O-antigen/teichoic acid export membrane protein
MPDDAGPRVTRSSPQADCSGASHPQNALRDRKLFFRIGADILLIGGATGLAQVVAFAAIPLITRLYEPAAFGRFALFSAAVTIVYPLASLRYEWALPLPQEEERALEILGLSIVLLLGSVVVLFGLAWIARSAFPQWAGISSGEALLFPLAVAACSLNGIATSWLTRQRAFGQIARLRFATTASVVALQAILGGLRADEDGLILGFVGGYVLGVLAGATSCRHALSLSMGCLRIPTLRSVAAEYRAFATITAPSNVLNAVGSQLPNLVFPNLYGLAVTGQYSLAQRVLGQPASVVCQAVNQVYWGNAARLLTQDATRLWPLFIRLNAFLLAAMAPIFVLSWVGPQLFSFVFGPAWADAGRYAGLLAIPAFIGLAAQGTTSLHIYRLNHWMGGWEILQLLLAGGALALAAHTGAGPMGCILAVALALAAANIILLVLNAVALRRVMRQRQQGPDSAPLPAAYAAGQSSGGRP